MATFKEDNVASNKEAKSLLETQIMGELEKMEAEKEVKKECDIPENKDQSETSPLNQVAS